MREKYTARLQFPQKRKGKKNAEWGEKGKRERELELSQKDRARENNGGQKLQTCREFLNKYGV